MRSHGHIYIYIYIYIPKDEEKKGFQKVMMIDWTWIFEVVFLCMSQSEWTHFETVPSKYQAEMIVFYPSRCRGC